MPSIEQTPDQAAAEATWRAVVDAQRDDFALMRSLWPQTKAPEFLAVQDRLRRRAAPGGDAEQAMDAVREAYRAWGRVPDHISDELEAYVQEQIGGGPLPAREVPEEELRRRPKYRGGRRRQGADDGR